MRFWQIFFIGFCVCAPKVNNAETVCEMEDRLGQKYADDITVNHFEYGQFTFENCKTQCQEDTECKGAYHIAVLGCQLFNTDYDGNLTPFVGAQFAVKVCTTVTEADATTDATIAATTDSPTNTNPCTMSQQSNMEGMNYVIELALQEYDDCKTACSLLSQCKDIVYSTGGDGQSCKLYTTTVTFEDIAGSTHGSKSSCSSGKKCCYEDSNDQGSNDSPWAELTASLSSCEALCREIENCQAVTFSANVCRIFNTTVNAASSTDVTLSTKQCPSGETAGSGVSLTYDCLSSGVQSRERRSIQAELAVTGCWLFLYIANKRISQ